MRADNRGTASFGRDAVFGACYELQHYLDAVDLYCKAKKLEAVWTTTDDIQPFLRLKLITPIIAYMAKGWRMSGKWAKVSPRVRHATPEKISQGQ